jgi:predicted nucleic acid-binding Zn ribbon protein
MVYFDVKPLGELIKEFYEQHRGLDYIDEVKAVNSWPKVVGPFIASHTIDLSVKNHVLFVRVDSDALRNELSYSKSLLLKNLNEIVGKELLNEIVLN